MVMGRRILRRRSGSAVIYIPVAALLMVLLGIYGISAFLRIIEIEVVGVSMYTIDDIIAASGISTGDNMLFVNTDSVIKKIEAALPYVSEASIEFDIPDRVRINISETTAMATIKDSGGVLVIDAAGRILEIAEVAPEYLVEIVGFTPYNSIVGSAVRAHSGDETRLDYLKEVLEVIKSEGIVDEVSVVDMTSIAYISFQYKNRFTVVLGTTDNIRYKFNSLAVIVEEITADRPLSVNGYIYLSDRGPARFEPER